MASRLLRSRALSLALCSQSRYGSVLSKKPHFACVSSNHYDKWAAGNEYIRKRDHIRRCSTVSHACHSWGSPAEILMFIKSSFNEPEGLSHYWFNNTEGSNISFDQDGTFLVLVNAFAEDSRLFSHHKHIIGIDRVKLLQSRYPKLNVFALQCCGSADSNIVRSQVVRTIMEEYITFPILIAKTKFTEMATGACFLLFEGSGDRLVHYKLDVELESMVKMIEEFSNSHRGSVVGLPRPNGDRTSHQEVKEPYECSLFRNLLLYYPGCISVDEEGGRLFISDSNHHRVIITDINGKILDCIGSSPGFEDGEFDSAKLLRPAASYYHEVENCLYIVDSENHAIRRADIEKRVLETVYPVSLRKSSGLWSWILNKLGLAEETDPNPEECNLRSITFPWHLLKIEENDFLITNRSFEMAWIMSMTTGEIKEFLEGVTNIVDIYGHIVMDKVSVLKNIYGDMLSRMFDHSLSLKGFPYVGLMSSIANFQNYTILCDGAGQRVLKFDRESSVASYLQFSDLGILGLPYWLVCPLEKVFNREYFCRPWNEHLRDFSVLPGRCDIRVNIDIPKGTELAAPLDKGCIWRQARGSAAEVSESENIASAAEKVGVAQQWFDELDNLAFSNSGVTPDVHAEDGPHNRSFQNKERVHFNCAVNISPGTSEVVIYAALYLKLKKPQETLEDRKSQVLRILDVEKFDSSKLVEESCIKFLLEEVEDVHDIVFMKPLHLRLRLECGDHPTAITHKETISTDSILEVHFTIS